MKETLKQQVLKVALFFRILLSSHNRTWDRVRKELVLLEVEGRSDEEFFRTASF
jgi:hypothetical protein